MQKTILFSVFVLVFASFLCGFALSGRGPRGNTTMHIKDLPQHGLRLIAASDPSFDERLRKQLQGEPGEVIDTLKPVSVFLENNANSTVVGYLIQWCFTKANGSSQYYRKALVNPQALMGGEILSPELSRQSGRVEPHSSVFISLMSPEGTGMFRTELGREEAEQIRQSKSIDQTAVMQRFSTATGQSAEITLSIDAAFFADGTCVGPDTTNFFDQVKAVIDAKRDFLNELSTGLTDSDKLNDSLQQQIQEISSEEIDVLDSKSTPSDYYKYFKKLSATEFLQTKNAQGEGKAIEGVLRDKRKPWATLRKRD